MARARDRRRPIVVVLAAAIARTLQGLRQFLLQHRLDELANPVANAIFDRVKPIVEKRASSGRSRILRAILLQGVVSCPARQRRIRLGCDTRRLRQPNFNHIRDGTVMATAKAIADEAPWADGLTEYDHAHFVTYARLLDATADGAQDDEIARVVLDIDPCIEPDRAKRCLASHMKRARWMSEKGYGHLLRL